MEVDVDWMEPEYVKNMPVKPNDQTSNQLLVNIELHRDSNADLLLQTAKELKQDGWLAVYTRVVCPFPICPNLLRHPPPLCEFDK